MHIKKKITFSFNLTTTSLFLPIMVDVPLEPNSIRLSKFSLHSFILFVKFSNIIYVFFFHLQYAIIIKMQRQRPSSIKLANITRWPITNIFVKSSIIIPNKLESWTLSKKFTEPVMKCKIRSYHNFSHHDKISSSY